MSFLCIRLSVFIVCLSVHLSVCVRLFVVPCVCQHACTCVCLSVCASVCMLVFSLHPIFWHVSLLSCFIPTVQYRALLSGSAMATVDGKLNASQTAAVGKATFFFDGNAFVLLLQVFKLTLSMPACFPVLATHCSGAELNCSKLHVHLRTEFIAISLYLDGFSRSTACWKDLDNRKPFHGLTARQAYQGHFHLLSKSPYHA